MAKSSIFNQTRSLFLTCLLWGGLLLCAMAVRHYWHDFGALLKGIGLGGAMSVVAAILLMWQLAVSSWRQVVAACSGEKIPRFVAARHLTLLLLGKYVPGGVWGFLARLSDSTVYGSLAAMTAAGLVEQWIGLSMVSLLGGIALAAAYLECWVVLLGAVLLPLVVLSSLRCASWTIQHLVEYLPARWCQAAGSVSEIGRSRQLWWAACLTMFQVIVMLGVAGGVSAAAFHLDLYIAIAVAGCYGIGVMAGIAAIFMPGGILVRESVFVVLCRDWITPAEAVALAGGLRLTFTAFDLTAGAGGAFLQFWRRRHV